MKNKPRILAIIPCRSGSKRLKNKNILPICGIPMWKFTWNMVCKSKLIDTAFIATDIKELYSEPRINIVKRPKDICTDTSPLDDTLRYVIRQFEKYEYKYDYVVMCHCNIPLRKEGEIDKLIKIALKNPEATSVVTGTEVTEPSEWMFEKQGKYFERLENKWVTWDFKVNVFRKQDIPKRYNIDGAIEIIRTDILMKANGQKAFDYFGDKIIIVPHEKHFSLEIDTKEDYLYAQYLFDRWKNTLDLSLITKKQDRQLRELVEDIKNEQKK